MIPEKYSVIMDAGHYGATPTIRRFSEIKLPATFRPLVDGRSEGAISGYIYSQKSPYLPVFLGKKDIAYLPSVNCRCRWRSGILKNSINVTKHCHSRMNWAKYQLDTESNMRRIIFDIHLRGWGLNVDLSNFSFQIPTRNIPVMFLTAGNTIGAVGNNVVIAVNTR